MRSHLLVPLLLVAACAKQPAATPAPEPTPAPAPAPAAPAPIVQAVYFDSGSAEVKGSQLPAVDEAAAALRGSEWSVLVVGLADSTGDPVLNKELSQKRAEAVAAVLRGKVDVPAQRIQAASFGERLATGGSTVSERKVEFVFYMDHGQSRRDIIIESGVLSDDYRRKQQSRH